MTKVAVDEIHEDLNQTGKRKPKPVLSQLGVYGLNAVEPVILAALFSKDPLLLIGPHGTGKSYLLTRISEALGLTWRHYNASLINYDDLVGYPLPNERRELEFVQTPASIWGAQAVFLDEISRCRADLQNKLFPIIHERRVQGILLETLEYRWAAMNPPSGDEDTDSAYAGSEPLDTALADRFSFLVTLPDWTALTLREQRNAVLKSGGAIATAASSRLRHLVASGITLADNIRNQYGDVLARYVCEVITLLHRGGIPCSTRRAAIINRNIPFVLAALLLTRSETRSNEAAYLALTHSLPDPAAGKSVSAGKVLTAHSAAWDLVKLDELDPLLLIRRECDPLQRALLAIRHESIDSLAFSSVIADSLAELPIGARHALATHLFESGAAGRLLAAVAEQSAANYRVVAVPQDLEAQLGPNQGPGQPRDVWGKIKNLLSKLDPTNVETVTVANLLIGLWKERGLKGNFSPESTLEAWTDARRRIAAEDN